MLKISLWNWGDSCDWVMTDFLNKSQKRCCHHSNCIVRMVTVIIVNTDKLESSFYAICNSYWYVHSDAHSKKKRHGDLILKDITVFSNSLSFQRQGNCSEKLNWIIWSFLNEHPFRKQDDVQKSSRPFSLARLLWSSLSPTAASPIIYPLSEISTWTPDRNCAMAPHFRTPMYTHPLCQLLH